jgi:dimethylhistidine N-methyltransferase
MNNLFAKDVIKGLTARPKYIPSKYFYDEKGDELFQKIMKMETYYLSDAEHEIMHLHKDEFLKISRQAGEHFNLIELGAGDGAKTKVLLKHFMDKKANFSYIPVDISGNVLKILEDSIKEVMPDIRMEKVEKEYFDALDYIRKNKRSKNIVLFMGGNIGNFHYKEAKQFLSDLRSSLSLNDTLIIGFDLKKDPMKVLNAYNDKEGITRDFNLNVLERINRELGGNFQVSDFYHYPYYDPLIGEVKSCVVSRKNQNVRVDKCDLNVKFDEGEPVFTEISKKYSLPEIEKLAIETGFMVNNNYFDTRRYFVNSVWQAIDRSRFLHED